MSIGAEMDHKELGFKLKWLKMGRNGSLSFVRLGFLLWGFKAWFLLFNSILRTLISPLDHNLEAIVEIERRMKGASCTQGTVSSISIVGSISPEGFLTPILLLVVMVVIVVVMVVVVVAVGGVPPILKLLFMVIGWENEFHQNKASSVSVLMANFTLFFSAHLLRENTNSIRLNQQMRPTAPFVPLK
ncbi:hypothetical protein Tco_0961590 [Tanacetum coccineum]